MLNYFLTQLIRSLSVFGRTIRAFFVRRCAWIISAFRRVTNVSRGAAKAANSAVQSAVSVAKNPSKREDYVETKRLLISKALILKVVLGLLILGLLIWFVVWPFVLSHFLTAHFYVEDSRVDSWNGRVVVYADEEKTIPQYAGRLEDGVLQGQGKEYDEAGLLCYEGQFQDGLRSGTGTEYLDGVVISEGQFALGVRAGTGTEYADGVVTYQGQFQDGVYEGQGKRYEQGILVYEGAFQGGAASGEGVAYHPNGQPAYKGQFAQGAYEGTGTAYDQQGAVVYTGGFSQGLYSGTGTLALAPEEYLTGSFQAGQPEGVATWSKQGKTYYEGEWGQGRPEGYGTLSDKAGQVLYEGQFSGGTLDGSWLLTLGVQELRDALGTPEERTAADGGFLICAPSLGLTALCSFQTEEEESEVHTVYLFPPEDGDGWVQLMPGTGELALPQWPDEAQLWSGEVEYTAPEGVAVDSGTYTAQTAVLEDSRMTVLYNQDGEVALVSWSLLTQPPAELELSGGQGEAPDTLDGFLSSLEQMMSTEGSAVSTGGGGQESPIALLEQCETADEAKQLTDSLMNWWAQSQTLSALESSAARLQVLLDQARTDLAAGSGSEEAVSQLEQELRQTQWELEQGQLELGKIELGLSGVDPAQLALEELAAVFDPSQADTTQLAAIAVAYAQAVGREVEQEQMEEQLQTALVELTQAYRLTQSALESYQWSVQAAQSAAGAYAMGSGSREDWYRALSAQEAAQAQVCTALAQFTCQANDINWTTGGWVSRTFDWCTEIFQPLYEAEIPSQPEQTPGSGEQAADGQQVSEDTAQTGQENDDGSQGEERGSDDG